MEVLLGLLIVVTLPTCVQQTSTQSAPLDEYCEWDTYDPQCDDDEVILVEKAVYGRMRTGSCITDTRDIGCFYDVTSLAHRKCSGRRNCEITIPDRDFDSMQPCGEMKNYLQIKNTCVKVEQGTGGSTCRSCDYIKASGATGYISSAITQENNCGGADCPWLIEAGMGQKIHVTIYDFNVSSTKGSNSRSPTCAVYAVLKEVRSRTSTTVCGGKEFIQELEVTENQSLEVRVIGSAARAGSAQFLLRYQVIGCADMDKIEGALIARSKDVTTVTCSGNRDVSWKLACNSTTGVWEGKAGECVSKRPGDDTINKQKDNKSKFPYGISLVLILSIAVVVGICILMIGICYFKRSNPHAHKDRLRAQVQATMADEAVYAEYGQNISVRDPRLQGLEPHGAADHVVDPQTRKFYQTYSPAQAQGMRNEYTHIWERPLPQPSSSLNKYPQAI